MPVLSQNVHWPDTMQVQNTIFSEPIDGANRRRNQLWAVNGMGGASRLNGMLWTRGSPGNYEAWSNMGLEEWAWDKVEPYFKKLENTNALPDRSQSHTRGHDGPIELSKPRYPFVWPK
jgi:choline dehydrogenase-like flavoprotein